MITFKLYFESMYYRGPRLKKGSLIFLKDEAKDKLEKARGVTSNIVLYRGRWDFPNYFIVSFKKDVFTIHKDKIDWQKTAELNKGIKNQSGSEVVDMLDI